MSYNRTTAAQFMFATAQLARYELDPLTLFGQEDDSLREALSVQIEVLEHWQRSGERLGGWKVGMSSRSARDSMGKGFRPHGYVLESRIYSSGSKIPLSLVRPYVEVELCLIVGERIGGLDVTPEQAREAVNSVAVAFELGERRWLSQMRSPSLRIADNLGQWGIVVGPEHSKDIDLHSLNVEVFQDGQLIDSGSSGPDVIDDPYLSLARLCHQLDKHRLAVEPGQRVITGSLVPTKPYLTNPGQVVARCSDLGEVTVSTFDDR